MNFDPVFAQDGETLLVETTETLLHCVQCVGQAQIHDRREHLLRDVPTGARAEVLVWWKRIWSRPAAGLPGADPD